MFKRAIIHYYPKGLKLCLLPVILLFLMIDIATAKVLVRCMESQGEQCKAGFGIMSEMVKRLGQSEAEYVLYDAKESKLLNGFWSLSFKDTISERNFIIYTNGQYLVPNVMPIIPGRDFKNVENLESKSAAFKAAVERENMRQAEVSKNGMPFPVNQITLEQNGMWLGPVEIERWVEQKIAYELIKGTKGHSKIIIIDNLMKDTAAVFIDEFRSKKEKWPDKEASIYFVPFFGGFGGTHAAFVGKYFYSLVESGVAPIDAVYNLSRLATSTKINQSILKEYCTNFVKPENKPHFLRMSLETPSETVIMRNAAAIKLGIMIPSYYIVNGQLQMWEFN
ncbi:MAG: hypothetical protein V2B19_16400 [Pseudomonadota bacterium]